MVFFHLKSIWSFGIHHCRLDATSCKDCPALDQQEAHSFCICWICQTAANNTKPADPSLCCANFDAICIAVSTGKMYRGYVHSTVSLHLRAQHTIPSSDHQKRKLIFQPYRRLVTNLPTTKAIASDYLYPFRRHRRRRSQSRYLLPPFLRKAQIGTVG